MKAALAILIILHGLMHLFGFFNTMDLVHFSKPAEGIIRINGFLWLIVAIILVAAAIFLLTERDWWWIPAFMGTAVSQYLIVTSWQDAKFGTIANIIILLTVVVGFGTWNFGYRYRSDVRQQLRQGVTGEDTLLTDEDIRHLPAPVKKYIYYTGVMNKPKVRNFIAEFDGQFRLKVTDGWMNFNSEQYNFTANPTRLFFMTARMKGIPASAYHSYQHGGATMDIRLLSLFTVEHRSGRELDMAETVTYFNDLCIGAPAALIDERIKWEEIDDQKVRARFTNNKITISAELSFNKKGELVNFISDDRYYDAGTIGMKKARWSTPISNYKEINGQRVPTRAEAVWSLPGGYFCYGKFHLLKLHYNVR